MDRLYYLTDEQFEQINRLLPPQGSRRGRPPNIRNREALEGILHVLRTGTPGRDVPKAYGRWHTIYRGCVALIPFERGCATLMRL